MARAPPRGVYTPVAIFFHSDESIDWECVQKHILRLARSGITGLVVSGSNGESVHLSRSERIEVLEFTRSTLDSNGFKSLPLLAGCGAHSSRETISHCEDAAKAGAEWALVLPPSYWPGAMTKPVIKKFFTAVGSTAVAGTHNRLSDLELLGCGQKPYPRRTIQLPCRHFRHRSRLRIGH